MLNSTEYSNNFSWEFSIAKTNSFVQKYVVAFAFSSQFYIYLQVQQVENFYGDDFVYYFMDHYFERTCYVRIYISRNYVVTLGHKIIKLI